MASYNETLIDDLRANGGHATSGNFVGRQVLILTTTGAKTGERRESPLAYTRDGDRLVVVASKGGAPSHPAWYHNIVAHPGVTVEVDGERFDAPAGTFVFVRPGVKRTAFGEEPDTTIVAVGGVPGMPYEPGGWELFAPLRPLYEAGDYAEAAERGRELLADDPPYADLFYNVACCESLAGQKDQAIAHLRRAIELSERTRAFLEGDSDLDPIRQEPAFKELLAG